MKLINAYIAIILIGSEFVLSLGFLSFEFVSCFVLRISDFNSCTNCLAPFQGIPEACRSAEGAFTKELPGLLIDKYKTSF